MMSTGSPHQVPHIVQDRWHTVTFTTDRSREQEVVIRKGEDVLARLEIIGWAVVALERNHHQTEISPVVIAYNGRAMAAHQLAFEGQIGSGVTWNIEPRM